MKPQCLCEAQSVPSEPSWNPVVLTAASPGSRTAPTVAPLPGVRRPECRATPGRPPGTRTAARHSRIHYRERPRANRPSLLPEPTLVARRIVPQGVPPATSLDGGWLLLLAVCGAFAVGDNVQALTLFLQGWDSFVALVETLLR
jgi:hypothetical protein